MRRRHVGFARLSLVTLIALAPVACATLQQLSFARPTVELQTVQITGLDLQGGSLTLLLDVYNPNQYELRTLRVDASLDLEDTHFGDASLERAAVLAPTAHTNVDVPIAFTWAGVGAGARALLSRGAVNYGLLSRLHVGTPIGERTVELHNQGQVPITQLLNR